MTLGPAARVSLVALLHLGCASRPPLPPEAITLNDQGIQFLARGELETADARFRLALEYNPRFVEALVNLGLVELERGNFTRAGQLLDRARRINEHVAQPHHGLGVLAERMGDREAAAVHYRSALEVDPGFAPARLNLARLLFDANELYHAKEEFSKLIQVTPNIAEAYAGLAETLIRLGRPREAERIVESQARRFPESSELQVLLARSELKSGKTDEAVRRLGALTERGDADAALAFSWLAVAELARSRPEYAIGAAKRALALDADSRVARLALRTALAALGDPRASEWGGPRTRPSR
jgi:tetratricopeptide (TPR) repeat protein